MRLLVTGGAGFIGSHTVDALVGAAHDVAVLDDLSSGKREQVNPRARFHQADLRDAERVTEVIEQEQPEVIFHLAAQMDVRRSVADPAFDAQVNLVGMLNLMEAARTRGLRRVIFASSGGAIYGEQDDFPCDESHPCRPVSPYGVAKLATEQYLFFYKHEYGIGYTAMRYGNVYGPRQDPHGEAGVVAIFCGRLLRGEPVHDLRRRASRPGDYVYVGDVARANVAALEHEVARRVQRRHRPRDRREPALRGVGRPGGLSKAARYARGRPGEQRRSVISPARARRANWTGSPSDAARGLAATLDFFKKRAATPVVRAGNRCQNRCIAGSHPEPARRMVSRAMTNTELTPQFLDYRAYRSRQVHPCRSAAGAHRRALQAREPRAVPRLDGPRARTRHHDQGPLRAP